MSERAPEQSPARRITFRLSDVFPTEEPLSIPLLRLMMAVNDVRHIQKLILLRSETDQDANEFERISLNGELFHLKRLLWGHLYEAGTAFRAIDGPHPELADTAVQGEWEHQEALHRLREAYSSDPPGAFHHSFLNKVRNQFGFHYEDAPLRTKLQSCIEQGNLDGTAIVAEFSGLSRYSVADHLSIGMLQDVLAAELNNLHVKFSEAVGKALALAGALGDIVDLMLLPLLERSTNIIKIEEGTICIPKGIMKAGCDQNQDAEA